MALVLGLLRRVLEYFGWPPDQAILLEMRVFGSSISRTIRTCLPSADSSRRHFQQLCAVMRRYHLKVISVCQKKEYGSTRSVVRRLGTILSIEPYPRPYFQLVQDPGPLDYDEQSTVPPPVAPSLADVLWVTNDEGQAFTRLRTELWRKRKGSTGHCHQCPSVDSIQNIPKNSTQEGDLVDRAALQKISALENELTFLRAQIAAIVSAQTLGSIHSPFKTSSTPDESCPLPAMTSTPLSVSQNHFVIPSPPPLPSGVPSGVAASNSAVELIKKRLAARNHGPAAAESADHQRTKNIPSMMDVLKDLNKVQLRATERSPGGTPLSRPKRRPSSDWDPVDLLTRALKQKFAHKDDDDDDSLDKENRSFDSSPLSSPEIPLVGCCSLKSNAKSSLVRSDELKQVPMWKVGAHI
ncbi:mitochondrial fission regulator 2 isoform X2 [Melopsittacus undulatus]|uniref:mitochondrial fission regulator 2 isoform X2 n=1 Tax=Melopsittacus undulatus TaxID=13146 RepID=UPI00146EADCE|nr:mitochondrial fission regulator 2 isoform X2 [Melopsittacus undulatus]